MGLKLLHGPSLRTMHLSLGQSTALGVPTVVSSANLGNAFRQIYLSGACLRRSNHSNHRGDGFRVCAYIGLLQSISSVMQRIRLNVGGIRYTTTCDTPLSEANSYFSCLLSGDWKDTMGSELFIDRDGELFKYILRFLRASPQGKASLVQNLSIQDRDALTEGCPFLPTGRFARFPQEDKTTKCPTYVQSC